MGSFEYEKEFRLTFNCFASFFFFVDSNNSLERYRASFTLTEGCSGACHRGGLSPAEAPCPTPCAATAPSASASGPHPNTHRIRTTANRARHPGSPVPHAGEVGGALGSGHWWRNNKEARARAAGSARASLLRRAEFQRFRFI